MDLTVALLLLGGVVRMSDSLQPVLGATASVSPDWLPSLALEGCSHEALPQHIEEAWGRGVVACIVYI